MFANRKVTGTASSMAGGLAWGGAVSMALTVILAVVTAKMVDMGTLAEGNVGYAALGILLISTVSGARLAAGRIKRRRLLVCLASGAIYYGLLLLVTALFFGGKYTGMGVTALAVLGGSGASCLMGMGQGSGRRRKHRRSILKSTH